MLQELTIRKPDDFHLHLRQGDLMKSLAKEAAQYFARVLVMPNTLPPIVTPDQIQDYHQDLVRAEPSLQYLMTFKLTSDILPRHIPDLKKAGAIAGKYYPQGVTTHSEDGILDIQAIFPVFSAMQEEELVLCIHGELPESPPLSAEQDFLPLLKKIHQNFPRLRIVLEHVSSKEGIEAVSQLPETVAATLTVHHALLTQKEVEGNPYLFCKPVCKTEKDRKAVMDAMISGNPKFFFGSDSAAHEKEKKLSDPPAPGIYSLPVALPLLAEIFEKNNVLDRLEAFTSEFGAQFYHLPKNADRITLRSCRDNPWIVPNEQFGIQPLETGKKMYWNA